MTHQKPSPSPGAHLPAQPIAQTLTAPHTTQHTKSTAAMRLANERAARQAASCCRCERKAVRGSLDVPSRGMPVDLEAVQGSESSEESVEWEEEDEDEESSAPSPGPAAARRRSSRLRRRLRRRFFCCRSRRSPSDARCASSRPPSPGRRLGSTMRLTLMPPPGGPYLPPLPGSKPPALPRPPPPNQLRFECCGRCGGRSGKTPSAPAAAPPGPSAGSPLARRRRCRQGWMAKR